MPHPVAVRDVTSDYRKLVAALSARAARVGSRDPEGAAQETLRRSLADARSRPAIDYYFRDSPPVDAAAPDWPLDRLLAWLHGVLRLVVHEESGRVSARREVIATDFAALDVRDPAPDQLHALIDAETHTVVRECFSALADQHRRVLAMRANGLKYAEIARRLGVSENTVATWVRRGTSAVARQVRERLDRAPYVVKVLESQE